MMIILWTGLKTKSTNDLTIAIDGLYAFSRLTIHKAPLCLLLTSISIIANNLAHLSLSVRYIFICSFSNVFFLIDFRLNSFINAFRWASLCTIL